MDQISGDSSFILTLDGDVPLDVFSGALSHWKALLEAVAISESIQSPRFVLTELLRGSARVGTALKNADKDTNDRIANRVYEVGNGLRTGNLLQFPMSIRRPAEKLVVVVSKDEGYPLTISTDVQDVHIVPNVKMVAIDTPSTTESIGSLTGRIQTLSSRDSLKFTLFDSLRDRAVTGVLKSDQREQLRELWDSMVEVEGWIVRDYETGKPLRIRDIRRIEPIIEQNDPLAFTVAKGVLKGKFTPSMTPEERIRLARNA